MGALGSGDARAVVIDDEPHLGAVGLDGCAHMHGSVGSSSPADIPPACTETVASGRSCGFSTCSSAPDPVSTTTRPFVVSGESANEKVSVEPAYHVRLEIFCTAW